MLNIKNIYRTRINYLEKIAKSFGLTEKALFITLTIVLMISSLSLLWKMNLNFVTSVPAYGGSFTEGLIGGAQFINPLLELSDSDRDLTYLIYSGLMRATASGDLIPDLAESYTVSEDGLTYTFKLRPNAYFHDGVKVTADDIIYTVEMTQDMNLRSPKRNNWVGVETKKMSETEVTFKLNQPYSPFLENTTLGILPKHIWGTATTNQFSQSLYNIEPIGSGPYLISKVSRNNLGIPASYDLKSFDKYTLGKPYITDLKFIFYLNENHKLFFQ
jgi:peptide/nickel transport system substrate-binding protein